MSTIAAQRGASRCYRRRAPTPSFIGCVAARLNNQTCAVFELRCVGVELDLVHLQTPDSSSKGQPPRHHQSAETASKQVRHPPAAASEEAERACFGKCDGNRYVGGARELI